VASRGEEGDGMTKPGELIILRSTAREQQEQIENLKKIGAGYMLQANELKGLLLCVLKKTGPMTVLQADLDAVGGGGPDEALAVLVLPREDEPGVLDVWADKVEPDAEAPKADA
jgi:hypothetical protein